MQKKLTKHGNSYALVIDKPILELLRIGPKTRLRIRTDGTSLFIDPANTIQRKRFVAALQSVIAKHGTAFEGLTE